MSEPPQLTSERRLAAVWFADIVGYSRFASQDERAALDLVRRFETAAQAVAERYHGRVVKFIGDAALAEFGSTEAAVRAALELRDHFAGTGTEGSHPASLRIGVHIGEVVHREDGDVSGNGVNVAARLQTEAAPDQVLVSEDVWRQLRPLSDFRFEAAGERELRGIDTRFAVFEAALAGDTADRGSQGNQPPDSRRSKGRGASRALFRRGRLSLAGWALAGLVVLAVAASGWLGLQRWGAAPASSLDSDVVAVLPFRVAGADPSLGYLREGMLDLLAAKLPGEGGPRAVDPRTLMSAWRRTAGEVGADLSRQEALGLAHGLGAGRLVLGEVVSLPGRVVLTASLSNVGSGRTDAPVSVEGPVDSLPALVDRLAAGLLSVGAGEGERLASLTTTSLPALRLYLEGQADYRSGRYDEAFTRFSRATEIDSTFALAALMSSRAAGWLPNKPPEIGSRALALAWRHRERLGERDHVLLNAVAGLNYPGYTSDAEQLAAWEALVRDRPDSPEGWFGWGDQLLHYGAFLDIPDSTALRQAANAFGRALALDPMYLPALGHLFDVAHIRGDTAALRRYGDELPRARPYGPNGGGDPQYARCILAGFRSAAGDPRPGRLARRHSPILHRGPSVS